KHPDDARLHLEFARALHYVDRHDEALDQAREAVRLKPDWAHSRAQFGFLLRETGDLSAAIGELREALRLEQQEDGDAAGQGQAILRWGLSTALRQNGQFTEAQKEIVMAVALQKELVDRQRGSRQLLGQLEKERATYMND